jgi:signal transduction histidine kinase
MTPASSAAPPALPATALAATLARLRKSLLSHCLVVGGLCLGIALILTAVDGRGFGIKLVYSLCIGVSCTVIVDATRLAVAWFTDHAQRRRGLVPQLGAHASGWRGAIPGSLLAMLLGPPLGLWLGDRFTGYVSPSLFSLGNTGTRLTLLFSVLATALSVAVLSALERLSNARAQAEAAQRLAAETQLRLLQSQLEPHMLFNTLANLRVLIGLDAPRAQAMLDRMIGFLRSTLEASRLDRHPLAAEFERIADYLALMAVRMGPRLQVQLDLPEALRAVLVPPLLLQPLVENAIHHGLEPKIDGGRITVQARRDGNTLLLQVRDTGLGLNGTPSASTGFGTAQVRARLATLYGSGATLTLAPATDGGALASVHLPWPESTP